MKKKISVCFFMISFFLYANEGIHEIEMIGLDNYHKEEEKKQEEQGLNKKIQNLLFLNDEKKGKTEDTVTMSGSFQKGNDLFKEKKYEAANAVFKSDFSDIKNIFGAATTDRFLGRYDIAIQEYGQAIQQDSKFAQAYLGRGLAYRNSGRYEEAVVDFQTYISLQGGEEGYLALGDTYMAMGRYREAQGILSKAKSKYPTSVVIKKMLSQAYLQSK